MTKKQLVIEQLMEGTSFASPNEIRRALSRRSLSVIEFYIHTMRNSKKEYIIQNIIRLG